MSMTRTEEQCELAAIVRAMLERQAHSRAVRAAMVSEEGFDRALWNTLCQQIGVAGLPVPEELGGAGYTIGESLIVLEELGRSLAPSPLLPSVIATEALIACDDAQAQQELLPTLLGGGIGTVVFGTDPVLYAAQAEVVLAVVEDTLVSLDPEVPRRRRAALDPTLQLGEVDLRGSNRRVLTRDPAVLARIRDVALVGAAALQVGAMQRALDDTVAYTLTRVQFGRRIGSFQALKHRMADLLVQVEMSRSALMAASIALSMQSLDSSERAIVAAAYCSESLAQVAAEMIQLHGGIAITWEHDAHLVLKRAHALGVLFGQAHQHRARLSL